MLGRFILILIVIAMPYLLIFGGVRRALCPPPKKIACAECHRFTGSPCADCPFRPEYQREQLAKVRQSAEQLRAQLRA